jgi:chromosome partitioning protein
MLTLNGLVAATHFVIPLLSGDKYSTDGLSDLLDFVSVAKQVNPGLQLLGMLLTQHDKRQTVCRLTVDSCRQRFGDDVFKTVIPVSTSTKKAPFAGQTVLQYDRSSPTSRGYVDLAEEICERLGLPAEKPAAGTAPNQRELALPTP